MRIGYARVSTGGQSLDVQIAQLKGAGRCVLVFDEKQSAKSLTGRTVLEKLLSSLETKCPQCHGFDDYCADVAPCETCAAAGRRYPDVLVVTKLDRLARNTRDLLSIVDRIGKAGAGLISLAEPWADTTTPAGQLILTVFAGIAEFERGRILERTNEGRVNAKKNGVRFGRPRALTGAQEREVKKMLRDNRAVNQVAALFRVHRHTISRLRD